MDNISNPFVECTARDMTYKEVSNFWCSPFNCFEIDEKMLHESTTPIVLEGARGSGKTMILKYLSYFCQKEYAKKNNVEVLNLLKKNKSIGFYFRYSDNFGKLFESLNCSSLAKQQLFKQYYELYMCCEIIDVLSDMCRENIFSEDEISLVCADFSKITSTECLSLEDVSKLLLDHISITDNWIRKSRYLPQSNDELAAIIKYDNLIYRFFSIIRCHLKNISDLNYILIIDEYENAAEYQIIFNTLIKQVEAKNKITYRIGTRPDGMNMNITEVGNEFLQPDRDFILRQLRYKNMYTYKKFVENIANVRLKSNATLTRLGVTNIRKLLGEREDLLAEAKEGIRQDYLKHFELLKKDKKYSDLDLFNETVAMLRNEDNPLAEMLNILWVLRGVSPSIVSSAMKNYFSNNYDSNLRNKNEKDRWAYKYKLDYVDKYKYQLLFTLLSTNRKNKKYYSFNTFCYLSSGAVNDFISLCRNTFYAIPNKYFENLNSISLPIAPEIQAKAAEITAVEQIDKVKLCHDNGTKMYNFLMSMGEVFRDKHKDIYIKYPETNQFAFEDISTISQIDVYTSLIKWGVIVKKDRLQSISIGTKKGNIFHLNRIYTPAFNISYRTRGGYNFVVSNKLFNKILSKPHDAKEILAFVSSKENKEITNDKTDYIKDRYQLTFFDQLGDEDGK